LQGGWGLASPADKPIELCQASGLPAGRLLSFGAAVRSIRLYQASGLPAG